MAEENGPDPAAVTKEHGDIIMQRVRVGLTGLAAVFLLTLLAASILNMLGQDDHAPAATGNTALSNTEDAPKEPLAELGMAPGNNAPKIVVPPAKTPPVVTVSPPAPTGPGLVPVKPAHQP